MPNSDKSEPSSARKIKVSPTHKPHRHKSLSSHILSPQDIAQEILERSKRKHPQRLPEGGDVIFTMKLAHRLANRVVRSKHNDNDGEVRLTPASTLHKTKHEEKSGDLDAMELLSILQDGAETHYLDNNAATALPTPQIPPPQPQTPRLCRGGTYKTDNRLDPELEKKLALKQLMEFSRKRGRPKRVHQENNNNDVPPALITQPSPATSCKSSPAKKRNRAENRELEMLLQDEGAINMLYAIEKGDTEVKAGLLPSKRRMKKALLKKAEEVKQAILGGAAQSGSLNLRHRTSPTSENKPRKLSVDSVDSEHSGKRDNFSFALPADASKIIRRHSSSSSYSSRSNSPRRMSIDHEKSPPRTVWGGEIAPLTKLESSPQSQPQPLAVSTPSQSQSQLPSSAHHHSTTTAASHTHLQPQTHTTNPTRQQVRMSEKTEKLIEMKCKELKLQPEHSDMIKQLVQQNKNGLKQRLQSEFATKLKAGISKQACSSLSPQRPLTNTQPESSASRLNFAHTGNKENTTDNTVKTTVETVTTLNSQVLKMVEEDWLTEDIDVEPEPLPASNNKTTTSNNNTPLKTETPDNSQHSQQSQLTNGAVSGVVEGETFVREFANISTTQNERYKELELRRIDNMVHVNIAPTSTYLPQSFNSQVLREMTRVLEELSDDRSCDVILLTCQAPTHTESQNHPQVFSNGLDLPSLLHHNIDVRKNLATEMATALKDLVCKLCMIGKTVIAGVRGRAVGVGVILLAYCDLVFASHDSTFDTSTYTILGYVSEAGATLALPVAIGNKWASKLLLGFSKLSATEAVQCGLVTKLLPNENFNRELLASSLPIAAHSSQSMETMKALMLHQLRSRIGSVLSMEVTMLREQWTTDESQNKIKRWANRVIQNDSHHPNWSSEEGMRLEAQNS